MMKLVVLSCVLAAAVADLIAPIAYTAPITYSAPFVYSSHILAPSNYRGPLSLAPGQPANIIAADGRPLDTLDVNLDRAAHYTTKALNGAHLLKKRSVASLIAPIAPITYGVHLAYSAPILAPSNYRGPLSLAPGQPANILAADGRPLDTLDVNLDRAAHYTTKALNGAHLLKKRSVASLIAPITYGVHLAYSAPILAPSNYRGPLSLAPGQPANILAADGRPLDTLDVNLDRAAHYTAKALNGAHVLKKRSVASLIAPITYGAHLAYSAPILAPSNYRGPLSLAPGQPANILAADGRPLDTLDVNLDRAAHYTAKALNGEHIAYW